MPNLKPCPLCWSEDIERRVTASSAKIRCRKCGVGISRAYFGEYGSRAEAEKEIGVIVTKLWNRRAESGTAAPTVEPKKGRWHIDDYDSGDPGYYSAYIEVHCSECGYDVGAESGQYGWSYGDPFPWKFCPNCGAKMDGDGNG